MGQVLLPYVIAYTVGGVAFAVALLIVVLEFIYAWRENRRWKK